MLKQIPTIISPDLLYTLMTMGHGDEIILADGNFPAETICENVIYQRGCNITDLLDAIVPFFPFDESEPNPSILMDPQDATLNPEVWEDYRNVFKKHQLEMSYEYLPRYDFYARAKKAFAVVSTSEQTRYANIIIRKGVV